MGQTNYGPAKAGIANMTVILAGELGRYGVTVNAISPGARTRMTETIRRPGTISATPADGFDSGDPANVSPLVVWLASPEAREVTDVRVPRGRSANAAQESSGPTRDDTLARMTQRGGAGGQTADETAQFYRERGLVACMWGVDIASSRSARPGAVGNDEMLEA